MDSVLKVLGAVLIMGGLTWMILVFATLRDSLPGWTAGIGASSLVLGFALLYRFGIRDAERKWDEGEWVQATGTVASVRRGRDERVLVRLSCPEHGTWTTRVQLAIGDELDALGGPGTPVEALVRSNDRGVVDLVTVNGRPWASQGGGHES
jgi:hypothetical protein